LSANSLICKRLKKYYFIRKKTNKIVFFFNGSLAFLLCAFFLHLFFLPVKKVNVQSKNAKKMHNKILRFQKMVTVLSYISLLVGALVVTLVFYLGLLKIKLI
jgi:uncharacterized membrane protein